MPVVSTPDTAHGENTSDRATVRPMNVSLTISARTRPRTSCRPTSTTTHLALNSRLCQNSGSSNSILRKFSNPMKPFFQGWVTVC